MSRDYIDLTPSEVRRLADHLVRHLAGRLADLGVAGASTHAAGAWRTRCGAP